MVAIADHQPPTVLIDLVGERIDVGGDLGLQRRREHLSSAVADQLVQQRPADPSRDVGVGLERLVDYLEHRRTFPNQRANAGPDQNYFDFRSSSGRCAPSRHQAEGHPQVLIIALLPPVAESALSCFLSVAAAGKFLAELPCCLRVCDQVLYQRVQYRVDRRSLVDGVMPQCLVDLAR